MANVAEQTPKRASESNARRSTRVSKTVPLSVSGYSKLGNSFLESTSAVSVNCHGCLYPSRYEYQAGSWVTLQMPVDSSTGKARAVRAQVRFMRLPKSPHELYLVGVELETPANVWGIQTPPEDWLRYPGSLSAGGVARAVKTIVPTADAGDAGAKQTSKANGSSATTEAPRLAAPASGAVATARTTISPDQLMRMLEGKLQQAADKVVATTLSTHLGPALEQAARAVEGFTQTSLRQIEQTTVQQAGKAVDAGCQEFRRRLQADMAQADEHLRKQVEVFLALAQETAQRLEKSAQEVKPVLAEARGFLQETSGEWQDRFTARLRELAERAGSEFDGETARVAERHLSRLAEKVQATASEAATRLEARADGARSQLETAAGTALAEFHVTARGEIEQSINEARKGVESSLGAFVANARADWDARQRACQEELARTGEEQIRAVRERLEGMVHASALAAISAVHDHSKSLLDSLAAKTGKGAAENS